MARIVEFTDGFTSASAPNNGPISASQLLNYASDGAYETANGAGQPGDLYFNTTTNKIRQHTASVWEDVVSASSVSATKFITFANEAAYVSAQGAAVSGSCFVDTTTTYLKVYDGAAWRTIPKDNEVMHLSGNETAAGNKTFSGDVVVTGDLTVNGTTVTLNTATVDSEDPNVTLNKGGNDASAEGGGITVDRTSADGKVSFDSALASKWKLGIDADEREIVTVSNTQTLTNKTLTSPSITTPTGIVKGDVGLGNVDNTSDATKNSAVATLTNKTLTTPEITDAILFDQISTPANPAASKNKIYFKADDKAYRLNSSGSEEELGSGAGGGGTKNYITNTGAEADTADYITFDDGAVTRPVDGTGGSPTVISLSRSTTGPLSGVGQFLITKTAASAQGEGVSVPFTIDLEDQGSLQAIEFTYKVVSGTFLAGTGLAGGEGDLIAYIYDVTNAVLIEPTNIQLTSNSTTAAKFYAAFQANSNSVSYRLILMCPNTGTTAYSLAFDSVKVGPQLKAIGPIVSDWTSFTPTGSWSTNTTYTGKWRRVGQNLEATVRVLVSGTPTTAALTVNLPSGLTIDTSALAATTNLQYFGLGITGGPTHSNFQLMTRYSSTTAIAIRQFDDVAAGIVDAGSVTESAPFAYVVDDFVHINFAVPILGWSSQVQMSADMGASLVAARAQMLSIQSVATGTWTIADLTQTDLDTVGGISLANNRFTAQSSGKYRVKGQNYFAANSTGSRYSAIYASLSGAASAIQVMSTDAAPASGDATVAVEHTLHLNAGDYVELWIHQSSGGNLNVNGSGNRTYFEVEKLANPSPILMSEKSYFKAKRTSGQTINATNTELIFDSVVYDSSGSYNNSNGRYTFKEARPYLATYTITCLMGGSATEWESNVFINGTGTYLAYGYTNDVTASKWYTRSATTLINATPGQYISVWSAVTGGGSTLGSSQEQSLFTVTAL